MFAMIIIFVVLLTTSHPDTPSEAARVSEERLKAINEEAGKYVLSGSKRVYTDWIVK